MLADLGLDPVCYDQLHLAQLMLPMCVGARLAQDTLVVLEVVAELPLLLHAQVRGFALADLALLGNGAGVALLQPRQLRRGRVQLAVAVRVCALLPSVAVRQEEVLAQTEGPEVAAEARQALKFAAGDALGHAPRLLDLQLLPELRLLHDLRPLRLSKRGVHSRRRTVRISLASVQLRRRRRKALQQSLHVRGSRSRHRARAACLCRCYPWRRRRRRQWRRCAA
mmetsp:Transcript_100126/g.258688  ORF Transcript_100126/g.258688 Transcript_100126/m.258688 type:complete len:224 (+) Transcript_100126:204-875(+)